MTAVGRHPGSAWRTRLNVAGIYAGAFVLCWMFATVAHVLFFARLASASQQAGTGYVHRNAIVAVVVDETSPFDCRGRAWSALFGNIASASISSSARQHRSSTLSFDMTANESRPFQGETETPAGTGWIS